MSTQSHEAQERALPFLRMNERQGKPRSRGLTEIRGPYYAPMGRRYLEDVLETMGAYVDILKFSGGSFSLMPPAAVSGLVEVAHNHDVLVSTGDARADNVTDTEQRWRDFSRDRTGFERLAKNFLRRIFPAFEAGHQNLVKKADAKTSEDRLGPGALYRNGSMGF